MKIELGRHSLPKVGEIENGDYAVFRIDEERRALIAIIDGLGHGPEAARVSKTAAEFLESVSLTMPLMDIMRQAHEKLSGSRGAAATVCVLRNGEAEACAVGNVELRTADFRLSLVYSTGILGVRVTKFHVCKAAVPSRSRLVLFSDGISSRTPLDDLRRLAPQAACDAIIEKYRRKEDDATIMVADLE